MRVVLTLIRAGKTCYLTIDNAILCPDRISAAEVIPLSGKLTVEAGQDRPLLPRSHAVVEVLPGEVRHLLNALVEGAPPGAGSRFAAVVPQASHPG